MFLTEEQKAILNGEKGETLAKVMESVVRYGELFGADKLVPITSKYNHLVTSFGLKMIGPIYDLMNKLIEAGAVSGQKFSCDPRPVDKNVPANFLQKLVFNKFMYSKQDFYEEQLNTLGLMEKDATPALATLTRLATSPQRVIFSAGANQARSFTQTPFSAQDVTVTPVSLILWAPLWDTFPTSVFLQMKEERLPG